MMHKLKYILFGLLLLSAFNSLSAQDIQFSAQAKQAVLSGEKFQLVYSVNEEGSDLRLPPLPDFTVLMGPSVMTSSSTQIINGKVTRSKQYTYTYILKSDKPGNYVIEPAQISIDGRKYSSNKLNIEVVKGTSGSAPRQQQQQQQSSAGDGSFSKDDLFIKVSHNKSSIYQGEPLVLTTKIYTRIDLDNVSDIKHPDFRNFIVQDVADASNIDWSYEVINNKQYRVGTFEKKVLYAQNTGTQTIEPTEIEFLIKQRIRRRSQSIFDDFFDNNYRVIKKRVKSDPIKIQVKPYPSGQPQSFSGAVGQLNMAVSASTDKVKVNDGITIKVVVSGTGNHKLMSAPELNFPSDFDIFDPTVKNSFQNTIAGMKGSKTFEYLIIPRFPGNFTIDPLKFSYFDYKTKSFKTISSQAINITVEKNGDGQEYTGGTYSPSGVNREDVRFVGKDIRFIKTGNPHLKPRGTFLFGSTLFYLGYIVPLLLLALAFILYRKRMHENANVLQTKNKRANKIAKKRLKKSSTYLKAKDHEAFYDEVLRALYTYLSDKLYLPVSELNKDKVSMLIEERGANAEVRQELISILDTCEFARFSPGSAGAEQMDKLYQRALTNISQLDNQIKN
ncbi:BatD family protein [Saccharicrinis carchari]|nr:BatD family protein [Saccharicrinis carchari]